MREIIFRGKTKATNRWVCGWYGQNFGTKEDQIIERGDCCYVVVKENTVSQYTGLNDKNGKQVFEGDILKYLNEPWDDGFECQSVVRFGEYPQDGSDGEYNPTPCIGWYVDVNNFTCPDWANNDPSFFHEYDKKRSLLDVVDRCEVIGNIWDDPELVEVDDGT